MIMMNYIYTDILFGKGIDIDIGTTTGKKSYRSSNVGVV